MSILTVLLAVLNITAKLTWGQVSADGYRSGLPGSGIKIQGSGLGVLLICREGARPPS